MSNRVDSPGEGRSIGDDVKRHRQRSGKSPARYGRPRLAYGLLGVVAVVLCASAAVGLSISPDDQDIDPASVSQQRIQERAARELQQPRDDSTTLDDPSSSPAPTQKAPKPNDAPTTKESESESKAPKESEVPADCGSYSGHQATACGMLGDHGFGTDQMECLVTLWEHESGWNPSASNPSSGAYGIPQALPGGKMASAGEDWSSNAATQIEWGLGYISDRYGDPCGAWGFWQANNYY